MAHAQEFLLQAYMVAGKDIFKTEDKKYYKSMKAVVKANSLVTWKSKKNEMDKPKAEPKRLFGEEKWGIGNIIWAS